MREQSLTSTGRLDQMISSTDPRRQALIHWLDDHGYSNAQLQAASSDASARRYYRFNSGAGSLIAVDTPLPETENQSFIDLAQTLQQAGLRTPDIYQADATQGWMLIEDLGPQTFAQALLEQKDGIALYKDAMDIITELQQSALLQDLSKQLPSYSAGMVRQELNIFTEWCLGSYLNIQLDSNEQAGWEVLSSTLAQAFDEQPQTFVHRDFHSRNLMRLHNGQLGLIDFQGAVRGPLTYDWVSLLRDCYVKLPVNEVQSHLATAYEQAYQTGQCQQSLPEISRWFDYTGLQRHLKAIGIFCRLKQQDGKNTYVADIPRSFNYVLEVAAQHEELAPLQRLIDHQRLDEKLC